MFSDQGKHSAYRSQRTPQVVEEAIEPKDFGESTPIGTLLAIQRDRRTNRSINRSSCDQNMA
jgi:hypothetical protein